MIRVHYNNEGKILGYYPENIEYIEIPSPYIRIEDSVYEEIVGHEDSYRIVDGKVVNISDSEEYREELFAKKFSAVMSSISSKAEYASKYAVLEVSSYSVNASWLSYFETLKRAIAKEPQELMLRVYELVDEKYYTTYISLSKKKTGEFINNSIATIQEYQDSKIPSMMTAFIEELQVIKESKDLEALEELASRISYGIVLNENETVVPIRI